MKQSTRNPTTLIMIRGPPGVGKSTLGTIFWKALPNGAVVEVDSLRHMQSNTGWQENFKNYKFAIKQAVMLVNSFLHDGFFPVIIIDSFEPKIFTYIKQYLHMPYIVITLMANQEELIRRVRGREKGYKNEADILNIRIQLLNDNLNDDIVIDTTNLKANEVFERINEIIKLGQLKPIDS